MPPSAPAGPSACRSYLACSPPSQSSTPFTTPPRRPRAPLRIRVRPVLTGPLRTLFAGIGAFELGNCAATLLILRATELLKPGRGTDSATTIALGLYVACNATATPTSLGAGRRTDRVGATQVMALGVAAFAVAYLSFTRDTGAWAALLPWFVLAGIGIGCVETAEHVAVATHAPLELRGSAFGPLAGVHCLGNLAASGIAGILWTVLSPSWAFAYLATWMMIALLALVVTTRRTSS